MQTKTFSVACVVLILLLPVACSESDNTSPADNEVSSTPTDESQMSNLNETDPFIWLEEVESPDALSSAADQNAVSVPRLQGDPRFAELRDEINDILTSDDRIPSGSLVNGAVYNFWQDKQHVRGILRRTSLANYASEDIAWETVLDIDSLAAIENANWVYKGRTCLPSDPSRCLIHLSDGGKDAVVVREFDLDAKNFVDGGFYIDQAKTRVDWLNEDTLLVGTDFGEGSLTTSGYPRTIRMWRRGSALDSAEQIIEIDAEEMVVSANSITSSGADFSFISRRPDFFTEETWLLTERELLAKLPLPIDANFQGMLGNQALVLLRSDWALPDGTLFTAGSLVALDLLASTRTQSAEGLTTILDPGDDDQLDAISGVAVTSESIYITALKDVGGILLRARQTDQDWVISQVDLPANGAVRITSADDFTDTVLVGYESFLVPDTLYLLQGDSQPQAIKALAHSFDASDYVTEQHFATSADGTRIPYFVVRPADSPMNGTIPVGMTAYGGFELSRTPAYMSALDQAWLTRGGAFVLANIRGGGEYGPSWHKAALLENRQRAFDDFIAVAEDLIASGLTSSEKLGIRGGSNGGLLVTAVMVQRPELFKAIISSVPLIDMLRYHKLLAGASWMAEYGNPDIPEQRAFISTYSPYQLVSSRANYPELFLWTNPKDDRVHPGHARKMAARMIAQGHDIIYFENAEGGHGGGANLNQLAVTNAMQIVYLLQQLVD